MSTRTNPTTGEVPLDEVIARDLAGTYTEAEIRRRIERCERYAALPGARPSDIEAVRDWRRILAVKVGPDR